MKNIDNSSSSNQSIHLDCFAHFQQMNLGCTDNLNSSFEAENLLLQAECYQYTIDISNFIKHIPNSNVVRILECATREYQKGLLLLSQGHYRHAFFALRLFFEQSLRAIYLSGNETHLQHWMTDSHDVSWGTIIDDQWGVFSKNFARAYFPNLSPEISHYRAISEKVYREMSEYVHGNERNNSILPATLAFSPSLFKIWHERSKVVQLLVTLSLTVRYISNMSNNDFISAEHFILENVGFLESVRELFNARRDF